MTADDQRSHLEKLLKTYTRNQNLLETQAASFGGEETAPIHIVNQLDGVREKITELQNELAQFGAPATSKNPDGDDRSVVSFGSGNDQRGANINISGTIAGGNITSGNVTSTGAAPAILSQVRDLLVQYFDEGDLQNLCFDLGVDYDSLPGDGKSNKARELVSYMQRRGALADLIAAARRQRPNASWPDISAANTSTESPTPTKQAQPDPTTLAASADTDLPKPADTPTPQASAPNQLLNQVTLAFEPTDDGATITWGSPLLGRRVTKFTLPYDEDTILATVIKALDAAQYPDHPISGPQFTADEQQTLTALKLWQNGQVAPNIHKRVGQAIYAGLGPDGISALEAIRNNGVFQRKQTNYVLRFPQEAVDIAALPWEVVTDTRNKAVLLTRGNNIDSCERYMDIEQAVPPPLSGGQVPHILALSPAYNIPDEVRQNERQARLATWDALKAKGLLTYDEIGQPLTRRVLTDYLRNATQQPDIIHFFGHGVYRDGMGYLLFDDSAGGKSRVSADQLSAILGDVRLIVIMACESAHFDDDGGLLTGVAPALSIVTGAVVAMQLTTRITAATRFAEVLYDELLNRKRSLQDAVAEGRQTLFFEEDDGASWYVPTIYIRSQTQEPYYITR